MTYSVFGPAFPSHSTRDRHEATTDSFRGELEWMTSFQTHD